MILCTSYKVVVKSPEGHLQNELQAVKLALHFAKRNLQGKAAIPAKSIAEKEKCRHSGGKIANYMKNAPQIGAGHFLHFCSLFFRRCRAEPRGGTYRRRAAAAQAAFAAAGGKSL